MKKQSFRLLNIIQSAVFFIVSFFICSTLIFILLNWLELKIFNPNVTESTPIPPWVVIVDIIVSTLIVGLSTYLIFYKKRKRFSIIHQEDKVQNKIIK